jgi:hypothetical protein
LRLKVVGVDLEDEELPLTPAESLRLIEQEQTSARRQLTEHPMTFFGPWGVAWLLGFGVMFLRHGPNGRIYVAMPSWLPTLILIGLLFVAGGVSGYLANRAFRHVQSESNVRGAMYGLAWGVTFITMGFTISRFADLLPEPEAILLWGSASVLITSALFLAGAALFGDKKMFGLGIWLALINIVGTIAGPGWHSLIISLAGGGGMLVVGLYLLRQVRRTPCP